MLQKTIEKINFCIVTNSLFPFKLTIRKFLTVDDHCNGWPINLKIIFNSYLHQNSESPHFLFFFPMSQQIYSLNERKLISLRIDQCQRNTMQERNAFWYLFWMFKVNRNRNRKKKKNRRHNKWTKSTDPSSSRMVITLLKVS